MYEPASIATYRTLRELSDDDRPREKLLLHGAGVLSDAELIAILVGSGTPGENVLDLARRLLETHGGLAGLERADAKLIQRSKGLGPAKSALLAAALELGRRVAQLSTEDRPRLATPEEVFKYLSPRMQGRTKEQFYVLSLDTKGRLLGTPSPLEGSVNGVSIRAAEVFREPILLEAVSVILAHNHPSGDARPSPQDISITAELAKAAALLDIELQDHVVIGQGCFVSLHREGYISHSATPARARLRTKDPRPDALS